MIVKDYRDMRKFLVISFWDLKYALPYGDWRNIE